MMMMKKKKREEEEEEGNYIYIYTKGLCYVLNITFRNQ